VKLTFLSGYASALAVPAGVKHWIKLQLGAMNENRQAEGAIQTYKLGYADRMLDDFRMYALL
jgi:hypothetical protein